MSVLPLPAIAVDANGMPQGHDHARHLAAQALRELINALPESVYYLNVDDATWATDVMLTVYLGALRREQR